MAYAITLDTEILNQVGVPVREIISSGVGEISSDGVFYSTGDIMVRASIVKAIVLMNEPEPEQSNERSNWDKSVGILHG